VTDGLLGHWTPPAVTGPYTVRLVAVDKAHNRTTALAPVQIGPRRFIDRFVANPALFSPNGDGRLETTTLEYTLRAAAHVTLDILRPDGTVARTLENDTPRVVGAYAASWNGLDNAGVPVPDGDLTVRLKAVDPATALEQQDAIALILDRAPPETVFEAPQAGKVVTPDQVLRGTVTDAHLLEYVVTAGDRQLGRGSQAGEVVELGSLASLPDGPALIVDCGGHGPELLHRVPARIVDGTPSGRRSEYARRWQCHGPLGHAQPDRWNGDGREPRRVHPQRRSR
jgi:hypothetical protein